MVKELVVTSDRMVRVGLNEKVVFEQRLEEELTLDCVDHIKLWKILKEMGIPDHLTCLLRILYAGQEATVRTRHGPTDWFQIGKGLCYLLKIFEP